MPASISKQEGYHVRDRGIRWTQRARCWEVGQSRYVTRVSPSSVPLRVSSSSETELLVAVMRTIPYLQGVAMPPHTVLLSI